VPISPKLALVITVAALAATGSATAGVATAATASCPTAPDGAANLASCASVTASSENPATGQTAGKAVDGIAGGYPGDHTVEWATQGGTAGSELRLDWSAAHEIGAVVLHDRPNDDDRITSATLRFADGSSVLVPELPNDGEGLLLEFEARATPSLDLVVHAVAPSTYNIGLSEVEVRAPQRLAAFLGTDRILADEDSVLRVLPWTVATVSQEGDERTIAVELELENLAGEVDVIGDEFVLYDADGTRYAPQEAPDGADEPLADAPLDDGERVAGWLHFVVPADSSGLLIGYAPADGPILASWTLNAP
jgi:hypothetical protein